MRSNQRFPACATRSITAPPIECASAKNGGGQSGSTTCCTKASTSTSKSEKSRTWPLRGSRKRRDEWPCPRQSIIATANPRSRRSRTVSKYFCICSPPPVKTQTVPLRPAGGAQRAKRNSAPSGVLMVPATTFSGTGLAGIETSVMAADRARWIVLKIKGGERERRSRSPLLEPASLPPISPSCRPLPVFRQADHKAAQRRKPGPMAGGLLATVAQWRTISHAYLRSHPVLPFHHRLRPVLFVARPGGRGRKPRLSALQYRAHR